MEVMGNDEGSRLLYLLSIIVQIFVMIMWG